MEFEKLVKKPKGSTKSSMRSIGRMEGSKSKVEASKTIHRVPHGPPPKGSIVHAEFFQMFTVLFVRMILPRLLVSQPDASKESPADQWEEVGQQFSIQKMNLQGLVPRQRSLHLHPSQRLHGIFSPQGVFHPPTSTPMTPRHPPRPPIDALPKPAPEVAKSSDPQASSTSEPAQQGPSNKQVRHKAFPHEQQASSTAVYGITFRS